MCRFSFRFEKLLVRAGCVTEIEMKGLSMTDRMSLTMLEQASEKPIKWADSIIVRRKGSMNLANIFDVLSGEI